MILMPLLTAEENLKFYLGMELEWLDDSVYELLKGSFKSGQAVYLMPHSQQRLLQVIIKVCSRVSDQGLLILDEPTMGLDDA